MKDSDPFKSFTAPLNKQIKVVTGIWLVGLAVNLAIIAGVVWVAVHFISKYW